MHFARGPFSFPAPLDETLRAYFWAGRQPSARDQQPLAQSLGKLWPLLAKQRGQVSSDSSKHYSFDAAMARAYSAYYLPANAMKLPLILEEAYLSGLPLAEAGKPLRWLDVGSGPGTAFWGLSWWAKNRNVPFEFWGLEQSLHFVGEASKLSRELVGKLGLEGSVRVHWETFRHTGREGNAGERQRQGAKSLVQWVRETKPRVVSMLNSIGELVPESTPRAALARSIIDELGAASAKDGEPRWLLLMEPGSQAASRELLELRETFRPLAEGEKPILQIWLPCLSARPCGALAGRDDWCHEQATCGFPSWMNELGEASGLHLHKESLLFSYLLCSVGTHPKKETWPREGMRVVSQLLREKGLVQCFVCTAEGKKRARVLNSRKTDSNEAFEQIVRGQIFEELELSEKGDVLSMKTTTSELDPTVFPKPQ